MGTQKQYTQEFKQDAVNYCKSHPELSQKACAENLGISHSSLRRWCDAQNREDDTMNVQTLLLKFVREKCVKYY